MELCRFLRWKSLYGARFDTEEDLLFMFARNEVPYSCLRTCRNWGPDDAPATPEGCGSHRACYERSEKLPRSVS